MQSSDEGRTRQAERLLQELLANGPLQARTVEARVRAAGVSRGTLVRARYRLGVVATKRRTERGAWVWALPGHDRKDHDGEEAAVA